MFSADGRLAHHYRHPFTYYLRQELPPRTTLVYTEMFGTFAKCCFDSVHVMHVFEIDAPTYVSFMLRYLAEH